MSDLVPLYRCKKCQVRMFDRDCRGHLIRCQGIVLDDLKKVLSYFKPGDPELHARPGDDWKPMHQPTRGRRKGTRVKNTEDDEDDEVLDVN